MAEVERKTRSRGLDAEKVDERRRRGEPDLGYANELAGGLSVFDSLLADPGMELPVERRAAILGDDRFSHPANGTRKALSVIQLQRDYGNAYVQRILRRAETGVQRDATRGHTDSGIVTLRQPASATIIARSPDVATDEELEELMERAAPGEANLEEIIEAAGETTPVEEAEFGAGTPSEEWPELQPAQRTEIRNLISTGRRQEAVDRLWGLLSLPERARVSPPPYVAAPADFGRVDGVPVGGGGALVSGLCIPYVVATSACAGCPESEHWQRHSGDELRAVIQIHDRVFERAPEEAVGQLLSTIMHEYTHAEQMLDEGLHEGIALSANPEGTRAAVGQKEFLTFASSVTPAERRRMEALQEIDAVCSEIENVERTGLTGLGLQGVINYLWDNYQQYHSSLGGNPPDIDVENRTYRSLCRGRERFAAYLAQTTLYSQSQKEFLLERCPEDYNPSLMSGRPLAGEAEGEHTETETE